MLARLREADSLSDLAWALTLLAEMELQRGDADSARLHAAEALAAAELVGRGERGGDRARDPGPRVSGAAGARPPGRRPTPPT